MNRAQKIAWFSIIALSAVLIFTAAITYWFVTKFGWQRASSGLCFIGFSCIAGLGPLVFRRDKAQAVHTDERDYLLELRAAFAGFSASFCFIVITGMTALSFYGISGTIKIVTFIILMVGSYVAEELVRSIAILSQYGWTGKTSIGD